MTNCFGVSFVHAKYKPLHEGQANVLCRLGTTAGLAEPPHSTNSRRTRGARR